MREWVYEKKQARVDPPLSGHGVYMCSSGGGDLTMERASEKPGKSTDLIDKISWPVRKRVHNYIGQPLGPVLFSLFQGQDPSGLCRWG